MTKLARKTTGVANSWYDDVGSDPVVNGEAEFL